MLDDAFNSQISQVSFSIITLKSLRYVRGPIPNPCRHSPRCVTVQIDPIHTLETCLLTATLLNIKGQVTLVPPQTQGRVRTNKKSRKVKESQVQQTQENIQALPVRIVSPLNSTNTPPKKAKRPRRNATQDATNAEDQGSSQSRSGKLMARQAPPFPDRTTHLTLPTSNSIRDVAFTPSAATVIRVYSLRHFTNI
jgi:hypothetical protein